jgi:single-stranded DNA-binding protein
MLNVVALNGRLTADPELRHTQNDIAVTNFTLAVDRSYVRQGAEHQADFIDIVCWRGLLSLLLNISEKASLLLLRVRFNRAHTRIATATSAKWSKSLQIKSTLPSLSAVVQTMGNLRRLRHTQAAMTMILSR